MTLISGNLLFHFRRIVIEKIGDEEFNNLLSKLKPETKKFFEGSIISSDMYNLDYYREILEMMLINKDKQIIIDVIEQLAEHQLRGIFGFIIKLISVEKVLAKTQIMWDKAYSEGKVEKAEMKKDMFTLRITDFRYTEGHIIATVPYFRRWLEIILKKDVKGVYRRINENTTEFIYYF